MNTLGGIFRLILLLTTFASFCISTNPGFKAAVNLEILKNLEFVDLNGLIGNKTLVDGDGILIEKSPLYKIHLKRVVLDSAKSPESVQVDSFDGQTKYSLISLKNIKLNFLADFDAEIPLVSDSVRNSKVEVTINELSGNFTFVNGDIHFSQLRIVLGTVDIQFQSKIFKTLYWIFKGLIVKFVNSEIAPLQEDIEAGINHLIKDDHEIPLQLGLGVNVTNCEPPQLLVFNTAGRMLRQSSGYKSQIASAVVNVLLSKYLRGSAQQGVTSAARTFLTFGVEGTLYQTLSPGDRPQVAPAVPMEFPDRGFSEDMLILLVSDYSLNSLLYVAQLSGQLAYKLTNSTNTLVPFNITTVGLSAIAPEFSEKFPEDFPMEIKAYVSTYGQTQPVITTGPYGSKLAVTFFFDFYVVNSTDPFDDPVKALSLECEADLILVPTVENDLLTVTVASEDIVSLEVKSSELESLDEKRVWRNLDNLLNIAVDQFKGQLRNIDVLALLEKQLVGINFSKLKFDSRPGYNGVSVYGEAKKN